MSDSPAVPQDPHPTGDELAPIAYVSMSPNPELQPVYVKVIKPTLESHGLICKRNEIRDGTALIANQVFEYIDEADLVLCDLTYQYGPAYYDLGIAHAFRKATVLISQTGDIPFDTRYQRVLTYKVDDRFSLLELRDALAGVLSSLYPQGGRIPRNVALPDEILPATLSELEQARIALFHHSSDAKRYALRFLGDNRDTASYEKIRSLISNDSSDPELVRDALVALCKIDPGQAVEKDLFSLHGLNHHSYIVREQAVLLIGKYPRTEKRVRRLIDQLKDPSWGVRVAVCQVLGKWRASEAASVLAQEVVDPEPPVRAAAEEALQMIVEAEEEA